MAGQSGRTLPRRLIYESCVPALRDNGIRSRRATLSFEIWHELRSTYNNGDVARRSQRELSPNRGVRRWVLFPCNVALEVGRMQIWNRQLTP